MATVTDSELVSAVAKRHASLNGILLFGTEEASISAAARQVLAALKLEDEPTRLISSALRNDAGMLDSAFKSLSLLGGRQSIIVEGCEEAHLGWLLPVIEEPETCNFVVMTAGSLNKASKLRTAATASSRFLTCGFYEETEASIIVRIRSKVATHGLIFAEGAAERFVALVGTDRGIVEAELEKLFTYAAGAKEIAIADVEASCGDQASFDFDKLIDAVLSGQLEETDRIFESLRADGEWKQALIMVQMHLARLEAVRSALDRGENLESAFRAAKPPIFFGQQKTVGRQMKTFSLAALVNAQSVIQQAILQSRQLGDLAEVITGRTLLSLARTSRQLVAA